MDLLVIQDGFTSSFTSNMLRFDPTPLGRGAHHLQLRDQRLQYYDTECIYQLILEVNLPTKSPTNFYFYNSKY